MVDANGFCDEYIQFQNGSASVFHVIDTTISLLKKSGFQELDLENPAWDLAQGKAYYVVHHSQKSLIAFVVGDEDPTKYGFNLIGSHSDSPVLRIRLNPFNTDGVFPRLLTQMHGV